jgi:hypothetical protein
MEQIPDKSPGDYFYANECNNIASEEENVILDAGITLSGSDLHQISKAVANYAGSGDYYLDVGGVNAYVLQPIGLKQSPTEYQTGMRARFFPNSSNTNPIVTVNVNSLGEKNIVRSNGTALTVNEIHVNLENVIVYDGVDFRLVSSAVFGCNDPLSPPFRDCILINNTTDPAKDIDFGPGYFRATGTDLTFHNVSTITKRTDAPWTEGSGSGGMSGGTVTASTWYHSFYIAKDDGTVDAGYDSDIDAVNLLAVAAGDGYKHYARRTSVLTDSTANLITFSMKNNTIWWVALPPVITTLPSTSFTNIIISAPNDIITEAMLEHSIVYADILAPFPEYYAGSQFGSLVAGITQNVNYVPIPYGETVDNLGSVANLNILADINSRVEFRYFQSTGTGLSVISSQVRTIGYKEIYNQ